MVWIGGNAARRSTWPCICVLAWLNGSIRNPCCARCGKPVDRRAGGVGARVTELSLEGTLGRGVSSSRLEMGVAGGFCGMARSKLADRGAV
eukprot:7391981-Prymnesium_polylepis.1